MSNTATISTPTKLELPGLVPQLKKFPITISIVILCVVAQIVPSLTEAWQLTSTNSIWSLFTGHLTHWSLDQLFWDALAFGVLGCFCERSGQLRFLLLCMVSSIAVSLAVMWGHPEVQIYRGLSGIDSALFAYLACQIGVMSFRNGDRSMATWAAVGWLLFVGKVSYELATGETLFVESASDFTALPISHVAGAIAGTVFSVLPSGSRNA